MFDVIEEAGASLDNFQSQSFHMPSVRPIIISLSFFKTSVYRRSIAGDLYITQTWIRVFYKKKN